MAESVMISGTRAVSPAQHLAESFAAAEVSGPGAVRIEELPFQPMVGLRAVPGTAAAAAFEAHLGLPLPSVCGAVSSGDGIAVMWLSPDEFLVLSQESGADLTAALVQALGDDPGSAIDLSANRTTLELTGPSARNVLEKGCPLDLHPRSFGVDTAKVTTIGSVPVIVWKVAAETYRILPRSSFADFLGRWLLDAMSEFRVSEFRVSDLTVSDVSVSDGNRGPSWL